MSSSLLSSASTSNSTAANLLINQNATGSGTSSSSSSSTDSMSALNYNFKEFLTLFTTQLKNQDPSNPMDTTQMTNQLAMFSQVEQQAGTNSRLDKLIAAQPSASLGSAVSYLGRTVQATGNNTVLSGGSAQIAYEMPDSASSVRIDIKDSNGALITSLTGVGTTGTHEVTWDGKDKSGGAAADGTYTVAVTALNTAGSTSAVTPVTRTSGKVTGIESNSKGTVLDIGGLQVNMSDVLSVQ